MTKSAVFGSVGPALALFALMSPAHSTSARTWVSGAGSDSNTCTRSAPCATFAFAYSQTSAGDEIDVLDPGDFGGLTITHSISINGGSGARIPVSGTITISAEASDVVSLLGLEIHGNNSNLVGIWLTSGGALNIQNCLIQQFTGASNAAGIFISPSSGTTEVTIQNTTIKQNSAGVVFQPAGGAVVTASVDRARIDQNTGDGLRADGGGGGSVTVALSNSSVSMNTGNGVNAVSGSSSNATINLKNDVIASNGLAGIQSNGASGGTAQVTVENSTLSRNGTNINAVSGGLVNASGNNLLTDPSGTGSGPTVGAPPTSFQVNMAFAEGGGSNLFINAVKHGR